MLVSGDIRLIAPDVTDAAELAALANDERVAATLRDYFPSPYSVDDALRWIDRVLEAQGPPCHWLIKRGGDVLGVMGVFVGEDVYRTNAELGYWVGHRYWGQGIATAAVRAATGYAFGELGMARCYATVFGGNAASIRVLEKCGYRHEYTLPGVVVKLGRTLDEVCLGVRREAWPPLSG